MPRFRGGVFWVWGGGGKCRFYFYGRGDFLKNRRKIKDLLTRLFSMGCFPGDFHKGNRPIEVGKWPDKEGKGSNKAHGLFSGTPPWWKTATLKRPIKRSMQKRKIGRL